MKESRFVKYAFAENGNKSPIDIERSPQGEVSIRDGYTPPYSNDPSAGGLYILREQFNFLMNYFTEQLKVLQINGLNLLDNTILTTIGYPMGARCSVWVNLSTGQLDLNGEGNPLCITMPIVSMKDNNQTNPYDTNALFKDWWLEDGAIFGEVKVLQANLSTPPDGYLDLAPNEASPSYLKESFPRVKKVLDASTLGRWGFFQSTSDTNFTIINPRGRFPRVWSNGGSIDSGRIFSDLQGDAIRNITGAYQSGWGNTRNDYGGSARDNRYAFGAFSFGDGSQKGNESNIKTNPPEITFRFDASKVVPTTDTQNGENRPYNFNQKMYIKV